MPPPSIPAQESFADLAFPARGVDLARGYGQQLPGTTPAGANVRTFEALTQRGRGGARPGLVPFVPQALPLSYVSGLRVIQHLNLIVDPQASATWDDGPEPTGDVLDDPSDAGPAALWATGTATRNPGRKVRRGGAGRQPNKQPKDGLTFVQGAPGIMQFTNTSVTAAYGSAVTLGNLLVAAVALNSAVPANLSSLSDDQGNGWVKVGAVSGVDAAGATVELTVWYAVARTSGTPTVTRTSSVAVSGTSIVLLEYAGNDPTPLDGFATSSATIVNAAPGPLTTGAVAVSTLREAVLGFFTWKGGGLFAGGFDAPTNPRATATCPAAGDQLSVNAATAVTVAGAKGSGEVTSLFHGFGVSFKRKQA